MKPVRSWSAVAVVTLAIFTTPASADAPPGRYTITTDTVRDTVTTLTWQRVVTGTYTLAQAQAYCQGLSLGGFGAGWRLPTKKELETLIDFQAANPALDDTGFPAEPDSQYWTSTLYAGATNTAWRVDFIFGTSVYSSVTATGRARCVR